MEKDTTTKLDRLTAMFLLHLIPFSIAGLLYLAEKSYGRVGYGTVLAVLYIIIMVFISISPGNRDAN